MPSLDAIVVGAGIAGLTCARELTRRGARVTVLEKSRGLGGRCATRRGRDGQPMDHGVVFYHGRDPDFLAALERVPADRIDGWPSRIHGDGSPCHPRAFEHGEHRLAYLDGATAFPKHLARNLDVRRTTTVTAVEPRHGDTGTLTIRTDAGDAHETPAVALAVPPAQAAALLRPLAGASGIDSVLELLKMSATHPALVTMAAYPRRAQAPPWEIGYPEWSEILQLVSHDSTKRRDAPWTVLVCQALAGWSRQNLDGDGKRWSAEMLEELGRFVGTWAREPAWTETHVWREARTAGGSELTRPVVIRHPDGARIGLTGEAFSPGGGVQAAWRAGLALAHRLTDGRATQ